MTQILRGFSQGLSNLAQGVAGASEDWPAASARQRQLELAEERLVRAEELDIQRQENFEATQRRLLRTEERQQRNSEISALSTQISNHKNMYEQYMQAGMKAEAQEELNILTEKKERVHILGLYGGVAEDVEEKQEALDEEERAALGGGVRTIDEGISGESRFPAEAIAPGSAGIPLTPAGKPAWLADEEGPVPTPTEIEPPVGPTVEPPISPLVNRLADANAYEKHNTLLKDLEPTAKESPELALEQYLLVMPDHLKDDDLTEAARKRFSALGKATAYKRLADKRGLWEKALASISKPDSPLRAQDVWTNYLGQMEAQYGGIDPTTAEAKINMLMSFDRRPNLGQEDRSRIGRITAIIANSDHTLKLLSDKKLVELIGGWKEYENIIKDRIHNWAGKENEPWVLPKADVLKVRELINSLGGGIDMMSRMMSGAALTADEVTFYSTMIGSIGQNPNIIRENMANLQTNLGQMRDGIWEAGYMRYGPKGDVGFDPDKHIYGDTPLPEDMNRYLSNSINDQRNQESKTESDKAQAVFPVDSSHSLAVVAGDTLIISGVKSASPESTGVSKNRN